MDELRQTLTLPNALEIKPPAEKSAALNESSWRFSMSRITTNSLAD